MSIKLDLPGLIRDAGFPQSQPLTLAARGRKGEVAATVGKWASGRPAIPSDLFYAASLTKQVTGAIAALLVSSGALDADAPIASHFLPHWKQRPTPRQLLHHIGSLSDETLSQSASKNVLWSNSHALELAAALPEPAQPPGSAYAYSNLGYILVATIMEQLTGLPFSDLAARVLPHRTPAAFVISSDGAMPQSPQVAYLGPRLPLSVGDGGLWTTAEAYVDFLDAQNRNQFGTARLTQGDHLLSSGEPTAYGWGVGIRSFRGQPLFIHGGSWTGARAKAVRCPSLGLTVVVLTTDDQEAVGKLVDSLCQAVVA